MFVINNNYVTLRDKSRFDIFNFFEVFNFVLKVYMYDIYNNV